MVRVLSASEADAPVPHCQEFCALNVVATKSKPQKAKDVRGFMIFCV
jgi:hypothetical protein